MTSLSETRDTVAPDHSTLSGGQAEYYTTIRDNVTNLLDGSFLLGDKDEEVSANIIASILLSLDARVRQAALRTWRLKPYAKTSTMAILETALLSNSLKNF